MKILPLPSIATCIVGFAWAVVPSYAQGPLAPPGAPAPTMKTLDQIEPRISISSAPFTITQPGSYYLTTNLTGTVTISTNDVTLDLMGFSIIATSGNGIQQTGPRANLLVRNGVVSAPQNGIEFSQSASNANGTIEDLRVYGCTAFGIAVGDGCRVRNCQVTGVGAAGIGVFGDSDIRGCTLTGNGTGLQVSSTGAYVAGNIVQGNGNNYDLVSGNQLDLLLSRLPQSIDWPANVTLAGSLTGKSGSDGITINASDVTLDLNGFALTGVPGSLRGIDVPQVQKNLEIRNGTVRDWGLHGVEASNAGNSSLEHLKAYTNGWESSLQDGLRIGDNSRVAGCQATGNRSDGISTGNGCTITDSTAGLNGDDGIATGSGCTITDSTASSNSGDGIRTGADCTITDFTAHFNGNAGMRTSSGCTITDTTANNNSEEGIVTTSGCTITDTTANNNSRDGISTSSGCTISYTTAASNSRDGIRAGSDCRVSECTARTNEIRGIVVGEGGSIKDCASSGNVSTGITAGATSLVLDCVSNGDGGDGIVVGTVSHVRGSVVKNSGGVGISALDNAVIEDCSVNNSGGDAISVRNRCFVRNNACDFQQSGAGIHVSGSDNRIEANSVTRNVRGLDVDIGGNLIIRNSARGNSTANYDIVAGNTVGPTVTSANIAVNESPHANYAF